MRMKPIPLMAFGLFFTINLSTERYLLVEIEDGVEGEMPEHTGVFIHQCNLCNEIRPIHLILGVIYDN